MTTLLRFLRGFARVLIAAIVLIAVVVVTAIKIDEKLSAQLEGVDITYEETIK